MPAATGVSAAIVPTDVPIASEMKHDARNIPGSNSSSGKMWSVRFTVASTAPMLFADEANAPARRNIHIISIMLLFPAPLENVSTLLFRVPLVVATA